jgi:hypothetical protein
MRDVAKFNAVPLAGQRLAVEFSSLLAINFMGI